MLPREDRGMMHHRSLVVPTSTNSELSVHTSVLIEVQHNQIANKIVLIHTGKEVVAERILYLFGTLRIISNGPSNFLYRNHSKNDANLDTSVSAGHSCHFFPWVPKQSSLRFDRNSNPVHPFVALLENNQRRRIIIIVVVIVIGARRPKILSI